MISKNLKIILIILVIIVLFGVGILYFLIDKTNIPDGEEEFPYLIDFSKANNIQEAQLERLKQDYELAVEKYKENPNSFNALMSFAFIYYQLGDYEKARDVYIKVGEISLKNYTSFWNLGNVYLKLEDYPNAEIAYLKTIENGPDQPRHYIALAELYWYYLPEKKEQIPDLYKKGLEALPKDYGLLVNLATYYKETGDKKNSLKYFQEIIKNYPDYKEEIQEEIDTFK